jgi:hypothetical protein
VFGNERPPLLAAAEREFWKALVRINIGSNALEELAVFLGQFENLELEYAGKNAELDWFSPDSEWSFLFQVQAIDFNLMIYKEWCLACNK